MPSQRRRISPRPRRKTVVNPPTLAELQAEVEAASEELSERVLELADARDALDVAQDNYHAAVRSLSEAQAALTAAIIQELP